MTLLGRDLRWTCHVCGEERPDAKIAVYSSTRAVAGGVPMTVNVRYCADREECQTGAPRVAEGWLEKIG